MTEETKKELIEKFLRVYSNLPLTVREETIATLEIPNESARQPVSWQAVFLEVKNNTSNTEKFLDLLNKMGLI